MNQLDKNIAVNLKRIRKSKNMSLDMMAEKTGVSKSMLGQIERGESNPTVATIAKIVEGIRVPFEGSYQVRSIFPYDRHRNFEVYETKIEPGERCESFLTEGSVCEYIMVLQGKLTLETKDEIYEVDANHAIKIEAGRSHYYRNKGTEELVLNIFVAFETVCIK